MSQVGVADDGVVYAGSSTTAAGTTSYVLYRWSNDSGSGGYTQAFAGDLGGSVAPNLRWGDNLAVRGAGANTQILIAPATGTNVALLRTSNGLTFQPAVIGVTGMPSGFAVNGIAFGPGTNTFWAKTYTGDLYLVQLDADAGTGTVIEDYDSSQVPTSVGVIGANNAMNLLAGLSIENPDNVRLYNVSDLTGGPVLLEQGLFTVKNANYVTSPVRGTGALVFGGNYLFALDSNNGIKAYRINLNNTDTQPLTITSINVQTQGKIVLTCQSVAGSSYQLQYKISLLDAWWNSGAPVMATGATITFTNNITGTSQFYRVQQQ
jgi:hypothetical protein